MDGSIYYDYYFWLSLLSRLLPKLGRWYQKLYNFENFLRIDEWPRQTYDKTLLCRAISSVAPLQRLDIEVFPFWWEISFQKEIKIIFIIALKKIEMKNVFRYLDSEQLSFRFGNEKRFLLKVKKSVASLMGLDLELWP